MIISVNNLLTDFSDYDFSKYNQAVLQRRLSAIEQKVRAYTENGFYLKPIKARCTYDGDVLIPYKDVFVGFKEGDTVEIYNSGVNDGLYTIQSIYDNVIVLDSELILNNEIMSIIKVSYPMDVVEGCVELLNYDLNVKPSVKQGVASESISRHSVSYIQRNESNTSIGYPSELLTFLKPYIEWSY